MKEKLSPAVVIGREEEGHNDMQRRMVFAMESEFTLNPQQLLHRAPWVPRPTAEMVRDPNHPQWQTYDHLTALKYPTAL